MNITVFPANNEDSFLIETEESSLLIDGGYVETYKKYIEPKLLELSKENKSLTHLIVIDLLPLNQTAYN
jgi:flavorubredoxin